MTGRLPKSVTPALVKKLNAVHTARAADCEGECNGVGYCAAVWREVSRPAKRTAERKE